MFSVIIYIKILLWVNFIGGWDWKHFSRGKGTVHSENICMGFITAVNWQKDKEELILKMSNLLVHDKKESQSCIKKKTYLTRVPLWELFQVLSVQKVLQISPFVHHAFYRAITQISDTKWNNILKSIKLSWNAVKFSVFWSLLESSTATRIRQNLPIL